jgi:hypothetical protein
LFPPLLSIPVRAATGGRGTGGAPGGGTSDGVTPSPTSGLWGAGTVNGALTTGGNTASATFWWVAEAAAVFIIAHVCGDRNAVPAGRADDDTLGVHRVGGERPIVVVRGRTLAGGVEVIVIVVELALGRGKRKARLRSVIRPEGRRTW